MDWLNYHHLYYFWLVAREGSIARAAEQLQLTHPTISKQLRQLETAMGNKLFKRVGRNLMLTDYGKSVFRYAEDIFAAGRELEDFVQGRPAGRPLQFVVGMPDVLPKLACYRLLKPAFEMSDEIQVICLEASHDELMAELAVHQLDLVLSDAPISPTVNVRGINHLLGECGITFLGKASLAAKYRRGFPNSLNEAPVLLPTGRTVVRRDLDQWLHSIDVKPKIIGEFEDTALMKVFGQDGFGLFPVPTAIEDEVSRQYAVRVVGRVDALRERYYAISLERRLKHPAVVAICKAARNRLFESAGK